jgi:hypothetical protein
MQSVLTLFPLKKKRLANPQMQSIVASWLHTESGEATTTTVALLSPSTCHPCHTKNSESNRLSLDWSSQPSPWSFEAAKLHLEASNHGAKRGRSTCKQLRPCRARLRVALGCALATTNTTHGKVKATAILAAAAAPSQVTPGDREHRDIVIAGQDPRPRPWTVPSQQT